MREKPLVRVEIFQDGHYFYAEVTIEGASGMRAWDERLDGEISVAAAIISAGRFIAPMEAEARKQDARAGLLPKETP